MSKEIRVFVISPHCLVREGLCALVERQADMGIVGNAPDAVHAFERATALSPAVIVMDAASASSPESIAEFIARAMPCPVLVIARTVEHDELVTLLRANVKGYLHFDATPAELVDAIRTVSRGELALHATAARVLVESRDKGALLAHGAMVTTSESLTDREREVLRLLCEGCSNKQIAQNLYISVRTVEGRLNSIYATLGVHSRAEVIVAAARMGWIRRQP